MKYYLDTEFDGHNGALLSLALVNELGHSMYCETMNTATDPWVLENVVPLMGEVIFSELASWTYGPENSVGEDIRHFIQEDEFTVISDSPTDITYFCRALSTGVDGGWQSTDYSKITFEVHNVDCYPTTLEGAVQHNAWWDAMALREKLNG